MSPLELPSPAALNTASIELVISSEAVRSLSSSAGVLIARMRSIIGVALASSGTPRPLFSIS